jgi:hypothetical protein
MHNAEGAFWLSTFLVSSDEQYFMIDWRLGRDLEPMLGVSDKTIEVSVYNIFYCPILPDTWRIG